MLFRVSSQFRRRQFNIESIAVGVTEQRDKSKMVITMFGDELMSRDFSRILRRTIDVIEVKKLDVENSIKRELALLRLKPGWYRVLERCGVSMDGIKVLYEEGGEVIIQLVSEPKELDKVVEDLHRNKILLDVVRTGMVVMEKGG